MHVCVHISGQESHVLFRYSKHLPNGIPCKHLRCDVCCTLRMWQEWLHGHTVCTAITSRTTKMLSVLSKLP